MRRAIAQLPLNLILLITTIVFSSSVSAEEEENAQKSFAEAIEETYGANNWYSQEALEAEIEVVFGEKTVIDGMMLMTPSTGGVRLELTDGTVAVWDGKKAWVSEGGNLARARFHLLTWPYFLAAPFKLQDPGTHIELEGMKTADDQKFETAKLTFGENVGDAPDDWYLIFKNPETNYIEHMAYIVTYGKDDEAIKAAEPHAISYDNFKEVEGVLVPLDWRFRGYNMESGPTDELNGTVKIRNPHFVSPEPTDFIPPEGATEDMLPE